MKILLALLLTLACVLAGCASDPGPGPVPGHETHY